LIDLALAHLQACAGGPAGVEIQDVVDDATRAVTGKVPPASRREAADTNLEIAQRVWEGRARACRPAPAPTGDALSLVMRSIAQ
jgi:hypothetical protein